MGSLFKVNVTVVRDFASFISAAQANGRSVYAAELSDNALALNKIEALPTDIFVIGNEGHGIPADISGACNNSVYIPISTNTESLNASVAAAIFMWEQGKNN
jgi:TrmH family RNA methyltransferase